MNAWRFGDHDNLLYFQSKKVLDEDRYEEILNDGSDVESDESDELSDYHLRVSLRPVVNIVVNNINRRYFPELCLCS